MTIRRAYPDDDDALRRLAALDCARPLRGAALVAEVGGELWAAVALDGAATIADPFRPTAELVGLLRLRAAQLAPRRATQSRRAPRPVPVRGIAAG